MCGEQVLHYEPKITAMGSPPRVRGTVHHGLRHDHIQGITPACAGNSVLASPVKSFTRDHPRVCGEQKLLPRLFLPEQGSPPRVRGTGIAPVSDIPGQRITPACAGNSPRPPRIKCLRRDHPRVCGEQNPRGISISWPNGSPPRVRGTANIGRKNARASGITPACAGNSRFHHRDHCWHGDHPRVCGEQFLL